MHTTLDPYYAPGPTFRNCNALAAPCNGSVDFDSNRVIGLSELESGTAKYCCVARFTAKSRCGKTTRFRRIRSQLDEDGELVFPSLASAPHLLNVLAQAATSFLALRGNQIRDEGAAYKKIAYLPARRMLKIII